MGFQSGRYTDLLIVIRGQIGFSVNMKLILLSVLVALVAGSHSFKIREREMTPAQWETACVQYSIFMAKMDEYEHQHDHDEDDHDEDDHDHDHDDGDDNTEGDNDEDDHDDEDHDEGGQDEDNHDGVDHDEDREDDEEGHCSGPAGLIHCIIADFGGDDECVDVEEFGVAWKKVGMDGEPQTQFFTMGDLNGDKCIDENEMMGILEILEEKCPKEEVTVEV